MTPDLRPETFEDALDLWLLFNYSGAGCRPEFRDQWNKAHPEGWGSTREEREAMTSLLIAWALKERKP